MYISLSTKDTMFNRFRKRYFRIHSQRWIFFFFFFSVSSSVFFLLDWQSDIESDSLAPKEVKISLPWDWEYLIASSNYLNLEKKNIISQLNSVVYKALIFKDLISHYEPERQGSILVVEEQNFPVIWTIYSVLNS